jgi:hypothetical protein
VRLPIILHLQNRWKVSYFYLFRRGMADPKLPSSASLVALKHAGR